MFPFDHIIAKILSTDNLTILVLLVFLWVQERRINDLEQYRRRAHEKQWTVVANLKDIIAELRGAIDVLAAKIRD